MERIDVEYATVGALLLAPGELRQVASWLRPEDFTRPVCGEVYGLVLQMAGEGRPVDAVTVLAELRREGRLRPDGYPAGELVRMVEAVPSPASVGYYGRLVVEAAVFRRVERAGTRLVQAGRSCAGEVDDVFALLREECGELLAVRRRLTAASGLSGTSEASRVVARVSEPTAAAPAWPGRAVADGRA